MTNRHGITGLAVLRSTGSVALMQQSPGFRWWCAVAVAVVARPRLWRTALRQVRLLARPGWWRTRPFLPLPDPEYLRFRLETQYGPRGAPAPHDVLDYLEWCRAERVGRRPGDRHVGARTSR